MTPEFIVYMLQEEFHILYSPFVQTKDNTFFSGFVFTTAQVASLTAMIVFAFISSFYSSNILDSYIRHFSFIFPSCIMNQLMTSSWLPCRSIGYSIALVPQRSGIESWQA